MNEQDHMRFEDDLAAYMLDALPGDEKLRFERHLDGCQRCQERARWLQGLGRDAARRGRAGRTAPGSCASG